MPRCAGKPGRRLDSCCSGFPAIQGYSGSASANIVIVGLAERAGAHVSFWDFTKRGAVVTAVSFALSVGYLWVRYFAFS
jgi:hypothetical protein